MDKEDIHFKDTAREAISAKDIKVNSTYRELFPKLSESQREALRNSIKQEGQHLPIIVNQEGVILDGHHRWEICQEEDIEVRFEIIRFDDPLEERRFVNSLNLIRRHLLPYARIEKALERYEIESKMASERKLSHLRRGRKSYLPLPLGQICPNGYEETGSVNNKLAKVADVSPTTFKHGKFIAEHASEEIKEKLRQGDKSIDAVFKEARKNFAHRRNAIEGLKAAGDSRPTEDHKTSSNKNQNPSFIEVNYLVPEEELATESVDLVIASRVYGDEICDRWTIQEIAVLANRVVKQGKFLALCVHTDFVGALMAVVYCLAPQNLTPYDCLVVKIDDSAQSGITANWRDVDLFFIFRKRSNRELEEDQRVWGNDKRLNIALDEPFANYLNRRQRHYYPKQTRITDATEFLIKHLTRKGETVYDPYGNSGTTKESVSRSNRQFVRTEVWYP